jgi:hypothetical protein
MKHSKNSLYLLMPALAFMLVHCAFSYATWDFNPGNWSDDVRAFAVIVGVASIIGGVSLADVIKKGEHHDNR